MNKDAAVENPNLFGNGERINQLLHSEGHPGTRDSKCDTRTARPPHGFRRVSDRRFVFNNQRAFDVGNRQMEICSHLNPLSYELQIPRVLKPFLGQMRAAIAQPA